MYSLTCENLTPEKVPEPNVRSYSLSLAAPIVIPNDFSILLAPIFYVFQLGTHKNQAKHKIWYRDLSCSIEKHLYSFSSLFPSPSQLSHPTLSNTPKKRKGRQTAKRFYCSPVHWGGAASFRLMPWYLTRWTLQLAFLTALFTLAKSTSADCMTVQLEMESMWFLKEEKENISFREYHLQRKHVIGLALKLPSTILLLTAPRCCSPKLTWDGITPGPDWSKFGSFRGWMVTICFSLQMAKAMVFLGQFKNQVMPK